MLAVRHVVYATGTGKFSEVFQRCCDKRKRRESGVLYGLDERKGGVSAQCPDQLWSLPSLPSERYWGSFSWEYSCGTCTRTTRVYILAKLRKNVVGSQMLLMVCRSH
jgi:hypothetical protein